MFMVLCFLLTATAAWGHVLPEIVTSGAKTPPPQHLAPHTQRGKADQRKHMTYLIGRKQIGSSARHNSAGTAEAFRFDEKTAGAARAITVYVPTPSTSKTLVAGLYTNSGGKPGSLLVSNSAPVAKSGRWVTVAIRRTPLVSGRAYWVAVLGKGGTLDTRGRRSASCRSVRMLVGRAALPRLWAQGPILQDCISAFVSGWQITKVPIQRTNPGASSPISGVPKTGGTTTTDTAPTGTPPSPTSAPSSTASPGVTGTALVGSALRASAGSWSNTPTSYVYQWQDCSSSSSCSNISGATRSTYLLQGADVAKTVDVVVTAANAEGSTSATSGQTSTVQTSPPPTNTALPAISGTTREGQTLTASNGSWSNSPASYGYQWQDCSSPTSCTNISGATGSSYALQSSDLGKTVDMRVTATNAGGSRSATSAQTSSVQTPLPPATMAPPTISGAPQQGLGLTASSGSWSNSPTSYGYQWQDCSSSTSCSDVTGATASSYTLQASDVGQTVDVVVTATNAGGSASATAAQTETVLEPSTGTSQSVAFWLGWSGSIEESQIPWNAVTQVDLFALKTTNGTALDATSNGISRMNVPAWVSMIHQHGRLAMISVGGSNDADWVDACNATNVSGFTTNLVNYMVANGFDGVDIDIESSPSNWASCVQAISQAAHAVTTQAGNTPIVSTDIDQSWMDSNVAGFYQSPDQFNLMYYGYPTGSYSCANNCAKVSSLVQGMHNTGHVPFNKMVLGMSPGGGQAQCCDVNLATTSATVSGPIMSLPVSSIATAIPAGNIVLATTENPPDNYQILTTPGAAACLSGCSIPINGSPTAEYSYPSGSYVENAYAGAWDCGNFARYAAANGLEGVMIWDLQEEAGEHNGEFPCFDQVEPYIPPPSS
jgi:hypothetical protein